jgi:hypothetical protein
MTGRRGIGRIGRSYEFEFEFELELELLEELELELLEELELELLDEFELELLDEFELELLDEFEFELELELELDELPPRERLMSSIVAGVQAAPPITAAAPMATALSRHGVRPVLGMAGSSWLGVRRRRSPHDPRSSGPMRRR